VYGKRDAILCIAIFIFLKIVWGGQTAKKEMTVVVLSGLLVVAFIFGAAAFYEDLESAGYTSRTLEMFTSGTMSVSQGRDELRQFSLELIWERPVFGYGLGGEYAVLFEKAYGLSANSSNFSSLTPHNGILQLMMNFGILIGTLLSVVLIRSIFYIKKVKDRYTKTVLIILCSIYIIPSLTVGDGIFVKPGIALFVFLILNWYQNRKKIKKTSL
jgi:O-antigen ligase